MRLSCVAEKMGNCTHLSSPFEGSTLTMKHSSSVLRLQPVSGAFSISCNNVASVGLLRTAKSFHKSIPELAEADHKGLPYQYYTHSLHCVYISLFP